MQIAKRDMKNSGKSNVVGNIDTNDSIKEVIVKTSNKNIQSNKDTVTLIDEKIIEKAV